MKLRIDQVIFKKELYPRRVFNNETVAKYSSSIDRLPPIIVSADYILIDGYHRLLAYRLANKETINVEILDIPDKYILWEAVKLNAKHGKQLELSEKQALAREFFKQKRKQEDIANVLSVTERTVYRWLKKPLHEARKKKEEEVADMHSQGLTQREISEKTGIALGKVNEIVQDLTVSKNEQDAPKTFVPDSLQVFNVWNFSKLDPRYGLHGTPGQIPGQIVENLLHYFTDENDLVVDPMAGGGTTLDVCKAMNRRCMSYDLDPLREDIKKWDIRKGFPEEVPIRSVDMVLLDPPYFDMVSEFNKRKLFADLKEFYLFIGKLAVYSRVILNKSGGKVALLMSDRTKGEFELLTHECCNIFIGKGYKCVARISVPLSTESANAGEVVKAKELKKLLGRDRGLYVFSIV